MHSSSIKLLLWIFLHFWSIFPHLGTTLPGFLWMRHWEAFTLYLFSLPHSQRLGKSVIQHFTELRTVRASACSLSWFSLLVRSLGTQSRRLRLSISRGILEAQPPISCPPYYRNYHKRRTFSAKKWLQKLRVCLIWGLIFSRYSIKLVPIFQAKKRGASCMGVFMVRKQHAAILEASAKEFSEFLSWTPKPRSGASSGLLCSSPKDSNSWASGFIVVFCLLSLDPQVLDVLRALNQGIELGVTFQCLWNKWRGKLTHKEWKENLIFQQH